MEFEMEFKNKEIMSDSLTYGLAFLYAVTFATGVIYMDDKLAKIDRRAGILYKVGKAGIAVATGIHVADFTISKINHAIRDWSKKKGDEDGGSEYSGSETKQS